MNNKPVAWEGAEEWEPLAWELCADEHGEESCHDLIWDMGVIPEPWGERWQKYEDEAKRMISMVRKCTHPVKELTDEEIELLETEIFVKDAIIKCYKEALEQIATGCITDELNNYKDTVYVMRNIASDALAILRKAQEK